MYKSMKPVCPKKLKALMEARKRANALIEQAIDGNRPMTAKIGNRTIPVAIVRAARFVRVMRKVA
jgi:hypothetical protein